MIEQVKKLLKAQLPSLQAAYIFGSWGTAAQRPDSDLDIAVLLPRAFSCDDDHWLALQYELASTAKCPVDLINLREVSTVFQKEIIWKGRPLYVADPERVTEFEALVLSLYQKLNDERAGIISRIIETGRVYAS
ncbi:nucleotidyltransferase domain-containing protein [Pontibacterium sp.]|uniref:type VII toxin-antitoxin system MntA family adenylyltransferase antitoxin n=1 Tax=Pontibacterium sp. TaxID=2036026 RepID=UPI003514CF50